MSGRAILTLARKAISDAPAALAEADRLVALVTSPARQRELKVIAGRLVEIERAGDHLRLSAPR